MHGNKPVAIVCILLMLSGFYNITEFTGSTVALIPRVKTTISSAGRGAFQIPASPQLTGCPQSTAVPFKNAGRGRWSVGWGRFSAEA